MSFLVYLPPEAVVWGDAPEHPEIVLIGTSHLPKTEQKAYEIATALFSQGYTGYSETKRDGFPHSWEIPEIADKTQKLVEEIKNSKIIDEKVTQQYVDKIDATILATFQTRHEQLIQCISNTTKKTVFVVGYSHLFPLKEEQHPMNVGKSLMNQFEGRKITLILVQDAETNIWVAQRTVV